MWSHYSLTNGWNTSNRLWLAVFPRRVGPPANSNPGIRKEREKELAKFAYAALRGGRSREANDDGALASLGRQPAYVLSGPLEAAG